MYCDFVSAGMYHSAPTYETPRGGLRVADLLIPGILLFFCRLLPETSHNYQSAVRNPQSAIRRPSILDHIVLIPVLSWIQNEAQPRGTRGTRGKTRSEDMLNLSSIKAFPFYPHFFPVLPVLPVVLLLNPRLELCYHSG